MINIEKLNKIYKAGEEDFYALRDVSFKIAEGEVTVILGPSGSGKSTLMNIIGGLDVATSGSVELGKDNIANFTPKQLAKFRRDKMGYIFQSYNLIGDLTVSENILVGANLVKNPLSLDYILEKVGLTEHKDKFPNELSGGQQQRVSIGRAIIKKPTILLCDEPTGALDFKSSLQVLELMQEINRELQTTIIMITHNTALRGVAHNILTVKSGEIIAIENNDKILPAAEIDW